MFEDSINLPSVKELFFRLPQVEIPFHGIASLLRKRNLMRLNFFGSRFSVEQALSCCSEFHTAYIAYAKENNLYISHLDYLLSKRYSLSDAIFVAIGFAALAALHDDAYDKLYERRIPIQFESEAMLMVIPILTHPNVIFSRNVLSTTNFRHLLMKSQRSQTQLLNQNLSRLINLVTPPVNDQQDASENITPVLPPEMWNKISSYLNCAEKIILRRLGIDIRMHSPNLFPLCHIEQDIDVFDLDHYFECTSIPFCGCSTVLGDTDLLLSCNDLLGLVKHMVARLMWNPRESTGKVCIVVALVTDEEELVPSSKYNNFDLMYIDVIEPIIRSMY